VILPTLNLENSLWNSGFSYIAGLDEVGRGSFAGPVVVGAVIFPKNCKLLDGVADSKLLKPEKREELDPLIKKLAVSWSIAEVGVETINKLGIGKATQLAFKKAVELLKTPPDFILIDAFLIDGITPSIQRAVMSGDKICASISAASIIAKVYRDDLMRRLSTKYPQYGLDKHKGYGTQFHRDAIKKHGLSEIHRKSFNLEKFLT
jgi:ribonuclease HII